VSCKVPDRIAPSDHAEASRGASPLSRLGHQRASLTWRTWLVLGGVGWLLAASPHAAAGVDVAAGLRAEIVVTGVPRPIELALDARGKLVVLSQGWRGDHAAEIYRIDPSRSTAVDAARAPRIVIPFADEPRKTAFGSLALDPASGDLFLGEENGNRIYRLGADHRFQAMVVGLNHLLGGSAIALDPRGRLVFLDFVSPEMHLRSETPLPPSLRWTTEEGYRGPVTYRVDIHEDRPLPRRTDLLVPILPRGGTAAPAPEPLWRLIGVAAADEDLVLLNAIGEVYRYGAAGGPRLVARLPAGHYHRTNLAIGPDGSVFVCGGFQVRRIFRISPAGEVSTVVADLSDPGGIVLDGSGALYVAETALHRIIRITPAGAR
jgi:hypothetical protein